MFGDARSKSSACTAAWLATDAVAELLRYGIEGNGGTGKFPFVETDPVPKLVEALVRTAEIERAGYKANPFDDEIQQLGQLIAALRKFHWDYMGVELPSFETGSRPRASIPPQDERGPE